jgi:hypothetical protein
MKGCARLLRNAGRVACTVCLFITTTAQNSSASEQVVSLRAPEMDWEQGRLSVESELRASGYVVIPSESTAVEPSELLLDLRAAAEAKRLVASVTVVQVGRTGIAYVWLRERGRLFRVVASNDEPHIAAHVLALRVSELITVPSPKPVDPPGPPSAPAPHRWELLLGLGSSHSFGLKHPSFTLNPGLAYRVLPFFDVELGGVLSLARGSETFSSGEVAYGEQRLAVRLLLGQDFLQRAKWRLGPSAGPHCLELESTDSLGDAFHQRNVCAAQIAVVGRLSVAWDRLSLWLSAEPGLLLPAIEVLDNATPIATLGRPWLLLSGGLAWTL